MQNLGDYNGLLKQIKQRIRSGQAIANIAVNFELLSVYWDIGQYITKAKISEKWGSGIVKRLAQDLKNEISEIKGFSERNIQYMINFYKEYPEFDLNSNTKLSVSELQAPDIKYLTNTKLSVSEFSQSHINLLISLTGWSHHVILIQKIKDKSIRYWYMLKSLDNGWSRDTLLNNIKNNLYERQGSSVNNFSQTLTENNSDFATKLLKDPYIFDFLTLADDFNERELELDLTKHIQEFLLELGSGFAFVGRQHKITISNRDFYIDLLFYHLQMRCYVVIELKRGEFLPEYAGKMNFYCSAVDDILKHENDKNTIGLILCQSKDKLFAEYSLKDMNKPIGISQYELTRNLPEDYKNSLPSIESIENELSEMLDND